MYLELKKTRCYVFTTKTKNPDALPCGRALQSILPLTYQLCVPWQEFEQVRVVGFQPGVLEIFTTPLLCVAVFTVVLL
jgi:hypothetical protein